MPKGFNYELLWTKDTQVLWIQTPNAKIPIGGVVSIVKTCNQDDLPCDASDYELIWTKDTKILWIKTPDGNFPIGGPGYMPCENQNQGCGSGLGQFIECLCQAIVGSSGSNSTDEKVKADASDSTAGYLSDKVDNETIVVDTQTHKLKVVATGLPGTDTKVKADENDPNAGYLSAKVDNTTIKVNTDQHKIYVADDSSIQKIRWLENNSERGVRSAANFKSTDTVSVSITDDDVRNVANIELSTPDDRSNQRVKVLVNGNEVGTRPTINIIGDNVVGRDNNDNNRVDITIPTSGSNSIEIRHNNYTITSPTSPIPPDGLYDVINFFDTDHILFGLETNFVDGKYWVTITGAVMDFTSVQKVALMINDGTDGAIVGPIHLVAGDGIAISLENIQNQSPNVGKVTISLNYDTDTLTIDPDTGKLKVIATGIPGTDTKVKADEDDPDSGYLSDKVDGSTIKVDTDNHKIYVADDSSIQKIKVLVDGQEVGTRSTLNLIPGDGVTIDSEDSDDDNRVNITISVADSGSGGGNGTDEKVKADTDDPNAGYLSDKIDDDSIKLDSDNHKIYATGVYTQGATYVEQPDGTGNFIGVSPARQPIKRYNVINIIGSRGIAVRRVDSDDGLPEGVADIWIGVVENTTHQLIRITNTAQPGIDVHTSELRFSPTNPINIELTGGEGGEFVVKFGLKIDTDTLAVDPDTGKLTVIATGIPGTDTKVKADADDPDAGYLSDKTDNDTVVVDTQTHKLKATGKVRLNAADETPGYIIEKIDNETIVIDPATNKLKVVIPSDGNTDEKVKIDPNDQLSGYLTDKIDHNTIAVDVTTNKLIATGKVAVNSYDTPGYLGEKIDNYTIVVDPSTNRLTAVGGFKVNGLGPRRNLRFEGSYGGQFNVSVQVTEDSATDEIIVTFYVYQNY
jgi:hypothetical protein